MANRPTVVKFVPARDLGHTVYFNDVAPFFPWLPENGRENELALPLPRLDYRNSGREPNSQYLLPDELAASISARYYDYFPKVVYPNANVLIRPQAIGDWYEGDLSALQNFGSVNGF